MSYVTIATDDFNRADASPIGGNWGTITGTGMKIASNIMTYVSDVDNGSRYTAGTWPDDQYCQMKVSATGTAGSTGIGPIVRCAAAANTCYGLYICHAASNNVNLYRRAAGAYTSITNRTQAFTDGDSFRLEVQGNTLRIYYKAAAATEWTRLGASQVDTTIKGGGGPGVGYSSSAAPSSVDDWEAGAIYSRPVNRGLRPAPFKPGLAR